MNNMTLYIIAGANGSGKSTLASELLPDKCLKFLNADDIIRRFHRSKNNFWYLYKDLVNEWNIFYNGATEYILVAQYINNNVEICSELLYNEFIKDLK